MKLGDCVGGISLKTMKNYEVFNSSIRKSTITPHNSHFSLSEKSFWSFIRKFLSRKRKEEYVRGKETKKIYRNQIKHIKPHFSSSSKQNQVRKRGKKTIKWKWRHKKTINLKWREKKKVFSSHFFHTIFPCFVSWRRKSF